MKRSILLVAALMIAQTAFGQAYTFPLTRGLECGQAQWLRDGSSLYVVGTITNTSNAPFSSVQVNINIYDKDMARIGSTLAMVANLGPGEVWKWKAMVLEDEAWRFRIAEVVGDRY